MKKSKSTFYSQEFKWKVVQEVLNGKYTKQEARKLYEIKSNCAILYWIRQFQGIENYRQDKENNNNFASMSKDKELQDLKNRIKELEEQNRLAEQRSDLWLTMIEVAEERLNIDIKGKSGVQLYKSSSKNNPSQK
jgi:transposase-like protein